MKTAIFLVFLLAATPAYAQGPQQPAFVPFTVTQADLSQLDTMFLNNPPRIYQQVIQQWLAGMEQIAQATATADAAKKKAAQDKLLPLSSPPPKPKSKP